jgi:hypothetical protein
LGTAVVKPDRYDPTFQRTFEEYAHHRGFVLDDAVVRLRRLIKILRIARFTLILTCIL